MPCRCPRFADLACGLSLAGRVKLCRLVLGKTLDQAYKAYVDSVRTIGARTVHSLYAKVAPLILPATVLQPTL